MLNNYISQPQNLSSNKHLMAQSLIDISPNIQGSGMDMIKSKYPDCRPLNRKFGQNTRN